MRAMIMEAARQPLTGREIPDPVPEQGQIRLRVLACAVCRTDLHILDGELTSPKLPLILGHQIVGRIEQLGASVNEFELGNRIVVPWLGWTCGHCKFCLSGRENLCPRGRFTGYTIDGGYAEMTVADARFCFRLPDKYEDAAAAPLVCAGLIGYRSLQRAGNPRLIGIYGFGAAAHIIAQVAQHQGRRIFAFTRPDDSAGQEFALALGSEWAGAATDEPPEKLEAAIIFAPAGELVPVALQRLDRGGTVVCGGIHMSDIPSFPYSALWQERSIVSVANLTRRDATDFLEVAARIPIRTATTQYRLADANRALADLRHGRVRGAAVLIP
jgi:propanol-preferring alcohol dehydrogenase